MTAKQSHFKIFAIYGQVYSMYGHDLTLIFLKIQINSKFQAQKNVFCIEK